MRDLPPYQVRSVETLDEQKRLLWRPVLEQTGHPAVVAVVAEVARSLPSGAQRHPRHLARGLQRWIQNRIRYVREYPERYQTPARTLEWGIGDCDDQAPLMAALARTCRIPARLCIGGWNEPPSDEPKWRHIWAQVLLPGEGWTSAETVRAVPLGFDAGAWMASRGRSTRRTYVGDRGPL